MTGDAKNSYSGYKKKIEAVGLIAYIYIKETFLFLSVVLKKL